MSSEKQSSSVATLEMKAHVMGFLSRVGLTGDPIPEPTQAKYFLRDFIIALLKVDRAVPGRVSCILSVKPAATNIFKGMHGGAVASVAEEVSLACARTVVGEKELFLGEISISYLSSAQLNTKIIFGHYVELLWDSKVGGFSFLSIGLVGV